MHTLNTHHRFGFAMRSRSALALALLVILAAAGKVPASAQGGNVPPEIVSLMQRATKLANTHRTDGFAALTFDHQVTEFDWVLSQTTTVWTGEALVVPNPPGVTQITYLAVFHAYHTLQSDGDHVHALILTSDGWRFGDEILELDPGGFRLHDHTLQVQFDIPKRRAMLTDSVTIECTAGSTPPFGLMRLSQDYAVTQLQLGSASGTPVPYQQVGGIVVFLPPSQTDFTLYLAYEGVLTHQGFDYVDKFEATLDSYWYPQIARLPVTATCTVTAPAGWTPIAQGELVSQQTGGDGSLTVTYRNDLPVCWATVDVGNFTITTRQVNGRTLSTYLSDTNTVRANEYLDRLQAAMAFFEVRFGAFPYTRYTIVQMRGSYSGPLEAYSFATFGPGTLPKYIVHELSHTWWGGLVPCTYLTSMWDEACAVYSDSLFRRLVDGTPYRKTQEGALSLSLRTDRGAESVFDTYPLSMAHDVNDNVQSTVGYDKGAMALRVLEEQIGQQTLMNCLYDFVANHPFDTVAEWPELEAAVNSTTGQDYRWFYNQWIDQTGMPALQIANVKTQTLGGLTTVEADIAQPDMPYSLALPIKLTTRSSGSVQQIVTVTGSSTHIVLQTTSAPVDLILDPAGIFPLSVPSDVQRGVNPTVYHFKQK